MKLLLGGIIVLLLALGTPIALNQWLTYQKRLHAYQKQLSQEKADDFARDAASYIVSEVQRQRDTNADLFAKDPVKFWDTHQFEQLAPFFDSIDDLRHLALARYYRQHGRYPIWATDELIESLAQWSANHPPS